MRGKIDVKMALRVFQVVTEKGQRLNDDYQYKGITASYGFDGYSVSLSNDYVNLSLNFHNTYSLHASNKTEEQKFIEILQQIDRVEV